MTALAADTDVEAVIGRALTSAEDLKVGAILDKASALFRDVSGQEFTAGTATVRLKSEGGRIWLPQHLVTSVTAVVDDDAVALTYTTSGNWVLVAGFRSHEFATISYGFGGTVPDLVRLTVAEIAMKVLQVDANAAAGVTQHSETIGSMSESNSYATWALGAQTSMSPEDKAVARSYRFRPPRHHVLIR